MRLETFVAARQLQWNELEALLRHARRGRLRGIPAAEMERFGVLYRHAASDLAIARRDFPDETVTLYLNGVCAQAHPLLARGEPVRLSSIPGFYRRELPRLFRSQSRYFLLSLAILFVGALAGYLAVYLRPDLRASLVPSSAFDALARGQISDLPNPLAGSWAIMLNNILVCCLCVILGVGIGIPTALLIVQTGWQLGSLGAAVHIGGYDGTFWPYIVPHGIVEISVVLVAGACGFMIADAMLRPRGRPRGELVIEKGKTALRLGLGTATLLIICGVIEGFISPSTLPAEVKVTIGVTYATLVYLWLLIGGRPRRSRPASSHDQVMALS